MSNSFSETSSEGWFGRIGGALKGMVVGVLAGVGAVVLLFWNEGRAVQTAKSLDEGSGAVISVSAENVAADNENRLVHITGEATTDEVLRDEEFRIEQTAIRLKRHVEMYQWEEDEKKEKKKKLGGGTETTTTYTYDEVWSDSLIDSGDFHSKFGNDYRNPNMMPINSQTLHADNVTVGAYTLNASLRDSIDNPSDVSLTAANIPEAFADRMQVQSESTLYLGKNPQGPEIGDCRVNFVVTKPAAVSVIAQQTGDTFQPYQTQAGDALSMLRMGQVSAEQMFEMAKADNQTLTWILRGVGIVVMFIGLIMFTKPISVLADVLPFLGNIAEMGLALVAGLLTIAGASLTIGIAWLFYRPLIGVPLVALSIGALFMLWKNRKTKATKNLGEGMDLGD